MGLESIGKHISEFRHLRKLRQEDLAEITGLSTNYIGIISERLNEGKRYHPLKHLLTFSTHCLFRQTWCCLMFFKKAIKLRQPNSAIR